MSTLRFPIEAGRFVRGQVRREITSVAWSKGCTVRVTEDKGFLESLLLFEISGSPEAIRLLSRAIPQWIEENAG